MKYLLNKFLVLAISLFSVMAFNGCTGEEAVVPKTVDQYKTELSDYVNFEIAKVNACILGFNKGDFKNTSSNTPNFDPYKIKYLADLNAVVIIVNKENVTIAELIKARSTLTTNGKLFNNSLWTADRRELNDLIVTCTAQNSSVTAGTDVGQASQAAKDTYGAAITTAKSVRDSGLSVQRMINEAVQTLNDAKTAFETAIIK